MKGTIISDLIKIVGTLTIAFPFILLLLGVIGFGMFSSSVSMGLGFITSIAFITLLLPCIFIGAIFIILGNILDKQEESKEENVKVKEVKQVIKKSEQQEKPSSNTPLMIIGIIFLIIPFFLYVFMSNMFQVYNLCSTGLQPTVVIKVNETTSASFNCLSAKGLIFMLPICFIIGVILLIYAYKKK